MTEKKYNYDLEDRLIQFAVDIIIVCGKLEGKKVLYQRSTTVDDAGDEMMMVMHAFSAGEQNTIMISSYYPKAEENKYLPLIEKSVLSARLRE